MPSHGVLCGDTLGAVAASPSGRAPGPAVGAGGSRGAAPVPAKPPAAPAPRRARPPGRSRDARAAQGAPVEPTPAGTRVPFALLAFSLLLGVALVHHVLHARGGASALHLGVEAACVSVALAFSLSRIGRIETERSRLTRALLAHEQALEAQKAWLEMVLSRMPTPLVLVQPAPGPASVRFANSAALALGYPSEAERRAGVPGALVFIDAEGRTLPEHEWPCRRVAAGERLDGVEVHARRDGDPLVLRVFGERLEAGGRVPTGVLALSDVTGLKDTERRLQEAVRARDEFLSIASHELKTPLTALELHLGGFRRRLTHHAATMDGARSPEVVSRLLDTTARQVTRMTSLVEDLLDVSRIRGGRLRLAKADCDLAALVGEVTARFAASLERADCVVSLRSDGPLVCRADRARLDQVISNLFSNAMKYAPGPLCITVCRHDGRARIEFRDRGPGIPHERQRLIFERFERACDSTNVSGLGLGLFIAREIVDAHGGTLSVESAPGAGAAFFVDLPLAASARPAPA